ncbi:hypothetical protein [Streptomyces sp. NPDC058677]|uniref:hypothetical protein n=1 Tax=Streptomyces sp. NPDC058677 TaxID=3346594 RepID=UPI00364FB0E2
MGRHVPQLIAQPTAFPIGGAFIAAVVISPYGGAGQTEIDAFAEYASLVPLTAEAPATGPWSFWRDDTSGAVLLTLNKPGEEHLGAVHVVMELADPPAMWWDLARGRAQVFVLWLPDARHPTTEEITAALSSKSGWMASARRVPSVELL